MKQSASWSDLSKELDAWQKAGKIACFWWRDDDVIEPTEALGRLLEIAQKHNAPLALAAIPEPAKPSLAKALTPYADLVDVLQHGWSHQSHSKPPAKKAELMTDRPLSDISAELSLGKTKLSKLFKAQFVPVLVPPWNRISPSLLPTLLDQNYAGLSVYQTKSAKTGQWTRALAPNIPLRQRDTHIDLIDWKGDRGFVGEEVLLAQMCQHLEAVRLGYIDPQPTGILSHHLVHDTACETFLAKLWSFLNDHQSTKICSARQIFKAGA